MNRSATSIFALVSEAWASDKARMGIVSRVAAMIAALITGVVLQPLFEKTVEALLHGKPATQTDTIVIILAALATFVAILTILLQILIDILLKLHVYDIVLHQDQRIGGRVRRIAFSYCSTMALRARRSIIVIGPHFEHSRKDIDGTKSHDMYLEESMTGAIQRHLSSPRSEFQYERIVQIDRENYRNAKEEQSLSKAAFNNDSMARHVDDILKLKDQNPHLQTDISVVARPYVPSFPSVLIVDDQYVFFSLPTDPQERRGDDLEYDTVLGFEDSTQRMPKLLKQIIRNLKNESFPIKRVNMDEDDPASPRARK